MRKVLDNVQEEVYTESVCYGLIQDRNCGNRRAGPFGAVPVIPPAGAAFSYLRVSLKGCIPTLFYFSLPYSTFLYSIVVCSELYTVVKPVMRGASALPRNSADQFISRN